jgi:Zn-dependent protease with chaperone function
VDAGLRPTDPPTRLDRIWKSIANRAGDSLYRQLLASPIVRPRFTISRLAAYAISLPVYAISIAIFLFGLWLIAFGGNLVLRLIGVGVTALAVVSRPRFVKRSEPPLSRTEAPELYGLVDELAGTLHAPRIDSIWITPEWNAGTGRFGLRQRTGLALGLPLWASLGDDERVALLSHEVAHGVNGDTARSTVVGNALDTLARWSYVLEPEDLTGGDRGLVGILSIPLNVLVLILARIVFGVAIALALLLYRDGQRAEFYADSLAASVAGSDTVIGMLARLSHEAAYRRAIGSVVTGDRWHAFFEELARQIRVTPATELQRLALGEAKVGHAIDATHPPTYQRVAILRSHPRQPTGMKLQADRSARIDAEMAPNRERVSRELADAYLSEIS